MADDEHDEEEELHNSDEELHNIDKPTEAEKRKILSTSVQQYAWELSLKTDKQAAEARDLERRKVVALEQLLQERQQPPMSQINSFLLLKTTSNASSSTGRLEWHPSLSTG